MKEGEGQIKFRSVLCLFKCQANFSSLEGEGEKNIKKNDKGDEIIRITRNNNHKKSQEITRNHKKDHNHNIQNS